MSGSYVPVVSYARISDDGEADEHGVSNQHRTNRRTAERLGWTIVAEITDNDLSASKAKIVREGFERIVNGFKIGRLDDGTEFTGVIVVNEDRLVRRAGDYERFVEALTAKPDRRFADERGEKDLYCETVEGMGLIGVAFSKMEARKIQRRMRQWHRDRAEDGKPPGGTRPFGWQDDRLTLEPTEAALLRKATEDFIAGRALNSIVRDWQQRGVKTSTGREWTQRSLRSTLDNPRLCGWRRIGGELVRDETGLPIKGQWAPIISPEQWQAIDAIISARKGRRVAPDGSPADALPHDHREHKYLLGGILRCGKPRPDGAPCNARLRVTHHRDCRQHLYACPTRSQGGCGGLGRRGDKVDEYITEMVLAKLEEREAVAADGAGPWPGETELLRIEGKLATLRAEWQQDQVSDDFFFSTVRQLEARQSELRRQRSRHEAATQRAIADVANVRRRWTAPTCEGGLDISQKRTIIREALHAVIVMPAGKGNGSRGTFNPDLLVPIWRQD
jgi:DNA invertase Pin-like site-specific DNA recombinase